jgi:hypothetical protein
MSALAYAAGVLTAKPVPAAPVDNNDTGWVIGFVMFGVVVAAVVALVVPILLLANKIGRQAPGINSSLQESQEHTAGLAGLETTIDHVNVIVGGLNRARVTLGG